MRYRPFGRDRVMVSEIGMGTWQLGGDWGPVDERRAQALLHAAVDAGVTFLDTADVYGPGTSEEQIGIFLKSSSRDLFVATKLGRLGEPGGPKNFTLDAMRRHTEASLRRLGVDVLDLTQLHCIPQEELEEGAVFDHLRTLKKEGKIKRFGASVETVEEGLICLQQPDLYSLQVIFNIFRPKPADELFAAARKAGVALIIRLPLASGLLSGKFTENTTFAETDHRNYNRDGEAFNVGETFAGLPFEEGVRLARALRPHVPAGMTMAQMAIRWVLDHQEVSVVIPGASRPTHIYANAEASSLSYLPDVLHKRFRAFYNDEVATHIRGPY